MLDKLGIIILILFVLSGLAVYDRYVSLKGEVGPVARALDYTGFTRFLQNWGPVRRRIRQETQMNFETMHAKLAQIQQKRVEMVQHRQEILHQLASLNERMQAQAAPVIGAMEQERQKVLERLPEIKSGMADIGNKISTEASGQEAREESPQAFIKSFTEFQKVTQGMDREYRVFTDNAAATEQQYQEGWASTDAAVRKLVQKLVQVTEEDLRELMQLYQELMGIQSVMAQNLDLNCKRLEAAAEDSRRREEEIVATVSQDNRKVFMGFVDKYQALAQSRKDLLSAFTQNENFLQESWQERWKEYEVFLKKQAPGNSAIFLAQRSTSLPRKGSSIAQSPADVSQNSGSSRTSPAGIGSQEGTNYPRSVTENISRTSLDEKIQPLRDRARDQGFYDTQKSIDKTLKK